jgi:magnesium chelatase family protein
MADHLLDIVQALQPPEMAQPLATPRPGEPTPGPAWPDLREVKGQTQAKRALEIAAAGGHSLLLVGPPGTGKSMLAQRLVGLLPPLRETEALESAAILSLAGQFDPQRWAQRVLRAPHHTASAVALVGGGSPPRPGEISLAHLGVLFLDELPEYPRAALEAMREPLDSGRIRISRAARQAEFPARCQLVAAMNPCPCGHLGSPLRSCRCSPDAVTRYQSRLSGPLLDRIDLRVEVPVLAPEVLNAAADGESTRVAAAREVQWLRQGCWNAGLEGAALDEHAHAARPALDFLHAASQRLGWSGRSVHRVLRIARSAADVAGATDIGVAHVAEAIQMRRALSGG